MAKRTTMNISLPPALKKWIDRRVDEDGFGTSSEFVRHILRETWEREGAADLDRRLAHAEREGPLSEVNAAFWSRVRRSATGKAARRSAQRRSA
ncbi:MAG: type II toxin-antitoxin system ParD family antitoxin [Phycisphaerales bacterium]